MIQTASSKPKPLALSGGLRVRRGRTCLFRGLLTPNTHTHTKVVDGFIIYTYYICAENDAGRTWTTTKILKKKKPCDVLMNLLYCNSSQLSGIKGLCNMCLPLVPLRFLSHRRSAS